MSTKPKFLQDIEKKLDKSQKLSESEKFELYQEVFSALVHNVQTFGPVLKKVQNGYESYIRFFL